MAKEKVYLRFSKGGFLPADSCAESQLHQRNYRDGELVKAQIDKLRNPGYHRLIHRIGVMCSHHIERFSGFNGHEVIKEIQLEGDIKCKKEKFVVPGLGELTKREAESISYENMDQTEFEEFAFNVCNYIANNYWKELTPEQIYQHAEMYVANE